MGGHPGWGNSLGHRGAWNYGRGLAQHLVAAGAAVHEVNARWTAAARRGARRQGKSDRQDARAVQRVLREAGLPPVAADDEVAVLALLAAQRDDAVAEATRLRCRLHQQLEQLDPEYAGRRPELKRDMDTDQRFFAQALDLAGHAPAQVTTDGHDAYARAIRETLGEDVTHRTSRYKNNRIEQDNRSIKQRYYPMRGFGSFASAARFCSALRGAAPVFPGGVPVGRGRLARGAAGPPPGALGDCHGRAGRRLTAGLADFAPSSTPGGNSYRPTPDTPRAPRAPAEGAGRRAGAGAPAHRRDRLPARVSATR
jgi:hypothetical protein